MRVFRFVFTAAIAAAALWSCEKAETEMAVEQPQDEFAIVQESPVNVIEEMDRATETIDALLYEQLADVSAVAADIVAAPDCVFPSAEVKECVVKLLRSIIPQDTTITRTLPFVYSNIDKTFEMLAGLQLELAVNEETLLCEVGPGATNIGIANFVTPSGDTLLISFGGAEKSLYKGIHKSYNFNTYGLYIEKNGSEVFNIVSEDEKDKLPSIFSESGLEFRHTHSGELSISAIDILLDYDVDFATGNMKYDFAMSMPLFADADTLLKVTGNFQQKGSGLNRKIESDQWFSMMDKGININVVSSDLKKMVGLMARTLLKDESGYPEEFCKQLSDEWNATAEISVQAGEEGSGYIYLGYIPVNEDDAKPAFFVPALLVHIYEYFGDEFTIPEFIEMMEPMLPSIPLPF